MNIKEANELIKFNVHFWHALISFLFQIVDKNVQNIFAKLIFCKLKYKLAQIQQLLYEEYFVLSPVWHLEHK